MAVQLGGLNINNPLALQPSLASAPAAPAASPKAAGYFWKGANGQVYVQGSKGINAAGSWDPNTVNYWQSRGFVHTPDSPGTQSNTASTDTGTGYGTSASTNGYSTTAAAPKYEDKSNDIALQNAGIGSVGETENSGIKAIEDAWSRINGQYNDDLATADTQYKGQTTDNNKDLQTNKQTALERGVEGRQGLFGTLASLGALSGTGVELANRAVQKGANEDLTTASNTYATNQSALDTGYNAYTRQEKRLQANTEAAKNNNETQVHNDAARSRQQYLTNLANDYQLEGKIPEAKNYASQAAALFPSISGTNVPTISLGYSGGAYQAPTLSQYVGKANNTTVQTTPGVQAPGNAFAIPGLVALNKKQGQ